MIHHESDPRPAGDAPRGGRRVQTAGHAPSLRLRVVLLVLLALVPALLLLSQRSNMERRPVDAHARDSALRTAALLLADADCVHLLASRGYRTPLPFRQRVDFDAPLAVARAAHAGRVVLVDDVAASTDLRDSITLAEREGMRSILAVPLHQQAERGHHPHGAAPPFMKKSSAIPPT